jgi:2-oxoglutarate ferredoxin oxidoreductase subunit gamma
MAKTYNMVFAGFGGQGVLFTGKVVAYAGLIDGREVSWLPSYGPEMRGGTANCSVCISDEAIGSPLVTEPDVLIAMNGPSFDKFIDTVAPGGKVIIDSSLIQDVKTDRNDVTIYKVPATQLSNDEHLEGIANIILLGKALKESAFSTLETVEESLKKCVPPRKSHLLEHNVRAVKLGMSL